jgi:hypothetical protein
MAKSQTTRLSPKVRAKDLELYSALKGIAGYAPANPAYTQQKMDLKHASVLTTRDAKAAADAAAEAADDNQTAAEWDLHNGILGAKDQVVAQFGLDSNEAQAMGLKKKSEYKSPTRKNKTPATG